MTTTCAQRLINTSLVIDTMRGQDIIKIIRAMGTTELLLRIL